MVERITLVSLHSLLSFHPLEITVSKFILSVDLIKNYISRKRNIDQEIMEESI